jgi:tetratricopeptide (TPR) repeat protein
MKAALIFAFFICSTIGLSSNIEKYNIEFLEKEGCRGFDKDVLSRVFGELRTYLSSASYINADIYFHGGLYDFHEDCSLFTPAHISSHCEKEDDNHDSHVHGHHPQKETLNPLLKISEKISIAQHRHLSGNEEKELLPWMLYAVKLSPKNEKAYVIGGYWLGMRLNKIDEAINFLHDGIKNNPESWDIYLMLGEIYLIALKDYQNARIYLEKAKDLAESKKMDKFDMRPIYTFLAEAYDKTGSPEASINLYEKLLKMFPGDAAIKKRVNCFKNSIL